MEASARQPMLSTKPLYRHAIELYLKAIIIVMVKRAAKVKGVEWAAPDIRS